MQVLEDSLSVDQFLCHEASGGKHSKTAVLKLLGGHDIEFLRVIGLEAEGIEANVSRVVVGTEETWLVDGTSAGSTQPISARFCSAAPMAVTRRTQKRGRHLSEVGDGGATDGASKRKLDPSTASPTRKPTTASMATRPCVTSASR